MVDGNMKSFAQAVRTARSKRGWTQGELARQLRVTQGTISFWENGLISPSLEHKVRLVQAMPEILSALAAQELALLDRIQALERSVFDGRCGCKDCTCTPETLVIPISQAREKSSI